MNGPQNAVVGNDSFGIDLPRTVVTDEQLQPEKSMAKFSKTKEFQQLKEYLESRINFYQNFLPDGRPVSEAPTPENWIVANAIIGEFKTVLQTYELAAKAVEDARRQNA